VVNCPYHPTRKVHFHCPECDRFYCPDCVIMGKIDKIVGVRNDNSCSKCNSLSTTFSTGGLLRSFRMKLDSFFTIPLGLPFTRQKDAKKKIASETVGDALLAKVSRIAGEGRLDEAIALVLKENGGRFTEYVMAEKYFELLKLAGRHDDLLAHGGLVLDMAVGRNRKKEAVKLYKDCLAVDPNFFPEPNILLKMVDWMVQQGEVELARETLERFTAFHEDHPMLYEAYLKLVGVLWDKMSKINEAKLVLLHLIQKYPGHELQAQTRLYWQMLKRQ